MLDRKFNSPCLYFCFLLWFCFILCVWSLFLFFVCCDDVVYCIMQFFKNRTIFWNIITISWNQFEKQQSTIWWYFYCIEVVTSYFIHQLIISISLTFSKQYKTKFGICFVVFRFILFDLFLIDLPFIHFSLSLTLCFYRLPSDFKM